MSPAQIRSCVSSSRASLVVLSFTYLGNDPDNEFFADRLTDELITALSRVPGLKVVARTSSFKFKGRANDIRGIGSTLKVDTVLEGNVRRQMICCAFTRNSSTSLTAAISGRVNTNADLSQYFKFRKKLQRPLLLR